MGRIEIRYDAELRRKIVCKHSADPVAEYQKLMSFDSPRIIRPSDLRGDYIVFPEYTERAADGIAGYCSEREAWRFLRDVSEGLSYLHGRGFLHLDIQPSNVLIGEHGYVIGDFDDEGDKTSYAFTPPEWQKDRSLMGPAADVWALGASVFYLLNGSYIFSGRGGSAQKKDTLLPRLSDRYSQELADIVAGCLSYEPDERPKVDDIYVLAARMADMPVARDKRAGKITACKAEDNYDSLWPEQMK